MFSNNKGRDSAAAPTVGAAPAAPPKRVVRPGAAPSIISSDVVLNGALTSAGDIQIDGRIEGDVHSVGLVIGESGQINGEILAEEVTVRGHVKGRIRARKVLLCAASHVEGDILHEAFAVEAGAFFEGNCRHSDNPLAEQPRKSADAKPAPQPAAPASRPADELLQRMPPRPAAPSVLPLKTGA